MKYSVGLISAALFSASVSANELHSGSWDFPNPDQIQVSLNRTSLFCTANPSRCPVGMRGKGAASGSGSGLVSPTTSASANNISVVLAGDNSSVTLSTSQDANDNTMSSDATVDAAIDYEQVLNY